MWNERKTDINKTELSLSAIMFFSPLIQNMLKKNKSISLENQKFISGFIKLWYFNIWLLIITIILQIIFYTTKLDITQTISTIITIILAISLVLGSIYAISWKAIIKSSQNESNSDSKSKANNNHNDKIIIHEKTNNKLEILINYIPLYNIYLRYKDHKFDNPDIILKESILLWSLFSIILIAVQNQTINLIIIIIIWIRIISLINDVDFGSKIKQYINDSFKKNPEELRWCISGTIITIFNKNNISQNITTQKNNYELLFKSKNKQIILEYIILFALITWWLYIWYTTSNTMLIFALLFIVSRYLIMLIKRNHLPHIPVAREITNIFFKHKIK